MILVDSSVWIDHLHSSDRNLISILGKSQVVTHPFVIGELALGRMKNRGQILHDLSLLPQIVPAPNPEILDWAEENHLYGKGISWVDAHLLFSCSSNRLEIWTRDKALLAISPVAGVKTHHVH